MFPKPRAGDGTKLGFQKAKKFSSNQYRFPSFDTTMIYDVNSPLFRSFLSQKGGSSDKRKTEEQRPKEQKPKANENKPVMNE
ncbi:Wound-inducible basic [Cynara cardunculus var. scolymus]|uniref:Wound-inducible basic n=1 Tax=Cynara cardunculus var. scolymus TaxID=59895 RepID=A0A103XNY9_CYNCS|nr:Wound-inducible basic [Cynara cardunculus var. scolymus]